MSFEGQWIGRYSGTNSGTLVVDLDDLGTRFAGTAVAWDDRFELPSTLVRLSTTSKDIVQKFCGLQATAIDHAGVALSAEQLRDLSTRGINVPTTVDVDLQLTSEGLILDWRSSIGTHGRAVATSATHFRVPSILSPSSAEYWDDFKSNVNRLDTRRYIFRGQENSLWRLRTSYHRTGRADLERYSTNDMPLLQRAVSALTNYRFDFDNKLDYASFISLAQHHGYPTPMLDWTWSPYIAAYFAFRGRREQTSPSTKARIFKFDASEWMKLRRADKLFVFPPHITILLPLAFGNTRAIPQQAVATLSNVDDMEGHVAAIEQLTGNKYLEVFDLASDQRAQILRELALMGINAGSMFPSLDGACETLKEENF